MGKTLTVKIPATKGLHRNPGAVAAKFRKAGAMKHRNAARGGARNLQADYLDEADDVTLDNDLGDWEDVA